MTNLQQKHLQDDSHRSCGPYQYCNKDGTCDSFCNCLYNEDSIDGKCIPNTFEYIKCDDKPTTEAPTATEAPKTTEAPTATKCYSHRSCGPYEYCNKKFPLCSYM